MAVNFVYQQYPPLKDDPVRELYVIGDIIFIANDLLEELKKKSEMTRKDHSERKHPFYVLSDGVELKVSEDFSLFDSDIRISTADMYNDPHIYVHSHDLFTTISKTNDGGVKIRFKYPDFVAGFIGELIIKILTKYSLADQEGLQQNEVSPSTVGDNSIIPVEANPVVINTKARGPTIKTEGNFEEFDRIKKEHPEYTQGKVAEEAEKTLRIIISADTVRTAYKAMKVTWIRGDRARRY
jgi:hypothetical protein